MPFSIQTTSPILPSVMSTFSPMVNTSILGVASSAEMPVTAISADTSAAATQFETPSFFSFLQKPSLTNVQKQRSNYRKELAACKGQLTIKRTIGQQLEIQNQELKLAILKEKYNIRKTFNQRNGDVFCGIDAKGKTSYIDRAMAHPGKLVGAKQAIAGCHAILDSSDYAECLNLQETHCNYWLKAVETERNLTACNEIKAFYAEHSDFFDEQASSFLSCEKIAQKRLHSDTLLSIGAVIGASAVLSVALLSVHRRKKNHDEMEEALFEEVLFEEEGISLVELDTIQTENETIFSATEDDAIEETILNASQTFFSPPEEVLPPVTEKKKKKDKKFAPSLRYADPPAYSSRGFSCAQVNGAAHGEALQEHKELEARLLEAKYQEMTAQQQLIEAKQKPDSDIALLQAKVERAHQASRKCEEEIRRMEFLLQVEDEIDDTIRTLFGNDANETEVSTHLDELPPSYAKTTMTGYTFQTFHEFCQAKRMLTADIEYWKDVTKLNALENKSNHLICEALKLFEPANEEANIEIDFAPIKLNEQFLSFLQNKMHAFESVILTSIVKKQIKLVLQRFADAIIEKMAEKLIHSYHVDLSDYIGECFTIINSRLQIKAKNSLFACIEKKLQDFEKDLISSDAKDALDEKYEQFSNELMAAIANEYINAIFSTLKEDILGNENLNFQETELSAKIKTFIDEITTKLAEHLALKMNGDIHTQQEPKEIIEKLASNITFFSRYQKQIHFSKQLMNNLLSPIESSASNLRFQPSNAVPNNVVPNNVVKVVKLATASLPSDEQI